MEDFPANVMQLPNRNLLKMDVQSCSSTEIISQLRKLAKAIFSQRKMQQGAWVLLAARFKRRFYSIVAPLFLQPISNLSFSGPNSFKLILCSFADISNSKRHPLKTSVDNMLLICDLVHSFDLLGYDIYSW